MAAVTPAKAQRLRGLAERWLQRARRSTRRRRPHRPGRRSAARRGAPWSSTRGGWRDGFARTCSVALVGVEGVVVEVQADLEPGVAGVHPGGAARQEPDGEPGPGSGGGVQLRRPRGRRRSSRSASARPPCPRAAAGFDLAVACAVLGAAERIDPRVARRHRDDRRAGPRRPGAARCGASCPRCSPRPTPDTSRWSSPSATAAEAALVPGVVGARRAQPAAADRRSADEPVPEEEPDETAARTRCWPACGCPARAGHGLRGRAPGQRSRPRRRRRPARGAHARWRWPPPGGHHLFLEGPPGAGKTMLAERLPALLPPLTRQESLEVTAVHSVAGLLPPGEPLVETAAVPRPAPLGHHAGPRRRRQRASPGPGAVSLAHRGVLFLDEAPEFAARRWTRCGSRWSRGTW